MSQIAPADAAARRRLETDLDSTLFVEAGAGTGKTTALVGRIARSIALGRVTMEHLAAITFTEAAAAELRDRVREALERAAEKIDHPEPERARCRQAVEEIDLAAIQTIHAFAGGLLRTYPLEAGLPPGLRMLDEIERGMQFEERFRAWFWDAANDPHASDVLRRALLLGLTQDHLRALAAALEEQHDLLSAATVWSVPPAADALAAAHALGATLLDLEPMAAYAHHGADDPLAQVVAAAQPGIRRLRAAETQDQALAALRDLGKLNATRGMQARFGTLPDGRNACSAIKATLIEVNQRVDSLLGEHRDAAFAALLELLRDFTLDGARKRKADGVATFQDLLAWARDLLRDRPDVRQRAQRRYQRIFVDEFQDTDPLQAEIAFYLAADESEEPLPARWWDIRLVPGKLFVVGDPKQSIYRFRRADIALYDALLGKLSGAREHLVQNFRSVAPLIDWVNHHFAAQMRPTQGKQPPYVALEASWDALEGALECGVHRLGGLSAGRAAQVASAEMQALALQAREAVEGGWTVSERGEGSERITRPARYRDVAILLPSRTHLRRLERELEEAGVPYRVESGKLVLATQEVRDLLACLRAVEDPSDQVALVAALRSPAYACSDPDLLRWREDGGRFSLEAPLTGSDGPVRAALDDLARFRGLRHRYSPPALIEEFIRERLLVASAFGQPRPREAWRRLRYVVARARAFTATGRHTLRAFLDWIDDLARAEVREAESAESEPDEDALRILTVHGAKGLEFPIVFLAGLGSPRHGRPSAVDVVSDRFGGALHCAAGAAFRTPGFEAAQKHEKEMAEAEAIRLLYVATTRARDHLVLSLYRGQNGDNSAAASIERGLASFGGPHHTLQVAAPRPRASALHTAADRDAETPWDVREARWTARRQTLLERLSARATAFPDLASPADPIQNDDLGWAEDEAPRSDSPSPPDVRRQVQHLLEARSGPSASPSAANGGPNPDPRVQAILGSDALARARLAPKRHFNLPLLGTYNGALVDLTVDLAYDTADGLVLVAYAFDLGLGPQAASEARSRAASLALALYAATAQTPGAVEIVLVEASGRTERFEGRA